MGSELSKTNIRPPTITITIFNREVYALIQTQLDPERIRISDMTYDLYSLDDLQRFLEHQEYPLVKNDYENESLMLMKRERMWYRGTNGASGSGLGYMWFTVDGREQSANFFIDPNREIWVVEPKGRKVYRLLPGSQVTLAYI